MSNSLVVSLLIGLLVVVVVATPRADQCPQLQDVDGFLIDLDGTINTADGLVEGATEFHRWLVSTNKPYVFLSNSASKGPDGVVAKFAGAPYKLQDPVYPRNVFTAAQATASFLQANAPRGSHIYIVQSTSKYGSTLDSCVNVLNRTVPRDLFDSWDWRTDMQFDDILTWAKWARDGQPVFYVTCSDGDAEDTRFGDPVTRRAGYDGWTYAMFTYGVILIQNGATYVNSAPDTLNNVARDPAQPDIDINSPSIGAMYSLIASATYHNNRTFTCGKGGNAAPKHMFQHGLDLLRAQGASGDPKRTVMIGDNLLTDIAGGNSANLVTVLVRSGFHNESDLPFYDAKPTCILPNVGYIPALADL